MGRISKKEKKGKSNQSQSKSHDPNAKGDIECYIPERGGQMRRDFPKWKSKKGKGKGIEVNKENYLLIEIKEINVIEISAKHCDEDAIKITSPKIYFTSALDFVFLTTMIDMP